MNGGRRGGGEREWGRIAKPDIKQMEVRVTIGRVHGLHTVQRF